MTEITRKLIFEQAARKLRQDFQELITVAHKGLKGQEGESLIREFLRAHLPKRFDVGSGFIIDCFDKISKQTDVVVYDALNCPVYRASENAAIFPSDNVAAVIEVKSQLDKKELSLAFDNIASTKRLAKSPAPSIPIYVQTATVGCVFAFESPLKLTTIAAHYQEFIRKQGALGHHIDIIVILDRGILTLAAKPPGGFNWNPAFYQGPGGEGAEGTHLAIGIQPLEEASLDAFLRFLLLPLSSFRGIVDHPGFEWDQSSESKQIDIMYLTSITFERDPEKRVQKLQQYLDEVKKDFAENPIPPRSE